MRNFYHFSAHFGAKSLEKIGICETIQCDPISTNHPGRDENTVAQFLAPSELSYSAADVVKKLLRLSAQAEPGMEAVAFAPAPALATAT